MAIGFLFAVLLIRVWICIVFTARSFKWRRWRWDMMREFENDADEWLTFWCKWWSKCFLFAFSLLNLFYDVAAVNFLLNEAGQELDLPHRLEKFVGMKDSGQARYYAIRHYIEG